MKHIVNQAQSGLKGNPLFSASRILSAMTLCPLAKCHKRTLTRRAAYQTSGNVLGPTTPPGQ